MLFDKLRSTFSIFARGRRSRTDDDRYLAGARYAEHPEAQSPTQVSKARIGFPTSFARRDASGKPNLVAGRSAIDALKDKFEIEPKLELADDDEGRFAGFESEKIATADLSLDGEAEVLEESFHRPV